MQQKLDLSVWKQNDVTKLISSWIEDNAVPTSDLGQAIHLFYWMNILPLSSLCLYLMSLLPYFIQTDMSAKVSYHPFHKSEFHMIQDGLNIYILLLIKVGCSGRKKNVIPVIVSR